ncbi:MAG: mannosyltransferase family protein [Chloroflexota bacterium]
MAEIALESREAVRKNGRFSTPPFRNLILLWLLWSVVILGFQLFVSARLEPSRPDNVLFWTGTETLADSEDDKPTLIDPFFNEIVSWDSEFYLSIALNGYDDPAVRTVSRGNTTYSLNYAFFPLYPMLMRVFAVPLSLFNLSPIGTLTLAGLVITLLGTLLGMVALYDMTAQDFGEDTAFRAVFYLLIFPTSFFFAQIYTEGLFIGLAFTSLALMRRKQYLVAAIVAGFAVWTRAVGVALGLALLVSLIADEPEGYRFTLCPFPTKAWLKGIGYAAIPALFYFIYSATLGDGFRFVERYYFGHSVLGIIPSIYQWSLVLPALWGADSSWAGGDAGQTAVYYMLEFAAIILGIWACFSIRKINATLFGYSLFVWAIIVFNGSPHSMIRYILAMPVIYIFLAQKGANPIFDRVWTMGSVLLLGLLAMLFSFDFWVA